MTRVREIPTVALRDGRAMPSIGFGTWQLSGRDAYNAVRFAIDAGYRHIDTAAFYRNENEVGRAIDDSGVDRDEIFLTTKMWPDQAGRERAAITNSLRALGMDYVDLWLVHWPPHGSSSPHTWQQFIAARDNGLTRAIGVSNYDTAQIDEITTATGEAPLVNQIPWSPSQHDPQAIAQHAEREIAITGYSPLKRTDLDDPTLTSIAVRHGVTPAQIVLRWHIEHGIVVIPKSAKEERIRANLDLFGFSPSADDVARIDALAHPVP